MSEQTPAAATPAADPTPAVAPSQGGFMGGTSTPAVSDTPAASSPSNFFGDHVQKGGQFNEGWTESLRAAGFDRLATKAATAKDESTLFRMMDDTLGFVGKKATGVSYPKEGASEDDIAAFRRDAGVPDALDGYLAKPDKLPDGVQWDDAAVKPYAEIFHKHHITAAAAQELISKHLEGLAGQSNHSQESAMAKVQQLAQESVATFQKEWGDHYDSRLEQNRAFVQSRFSPEDLIDPAMQAAMSNPKVVRIIDEARRALREAPLPGVGQEVMSGSHSPRQQANEMMKANPRWRNDPETFNRVTELYKLDYAQTNRRGK